MLETVRYIEVLPYRCGHVCKHALEDRTHCRCPNPSGAAHLQVAIETARQRGGPCGPEANHMRLQ